MLSWSYLLTALWVMGRSSPAERLYYGVFLRSGVIRLLSDLPHIGAPQLLFCAFSGFHRLIRLKLRFMVKRIMLFGLILPLVFLDRLTAHELLRGRLCL